MNIPESVSGLLTSSFGVDPLAIGIDVPLCRLRMDSLALEELRLLLEERWHVDLEDVELTSRNTVGQLVTVVQNATARREAV